MDDTMCESCSPVVAVCTPRLDPTSTDQHRRPASGAEPAL